MNMRIIFSWALIIFGVGFLIDAFDVWHFRSIVADWWPLIIVAVGVRNISKSRRSIFNGVIVLLVGILLLASSLDLIQSGFWSIFWPMIIILIGVKLILGSSNRFNNWKRSGKNNEIISIFSSSKHIMNDSNIGDGEVNSIFGSVYLDYRNVDNPPELIKLEVNSIFASVRIKIPLHWSLEVKGTPVFGEIDDDTKHSADSTELTTLRMNCYSVFGSIKITN